MSTPCTMRDNSFECVAIFTVLCIIINKYITRTTRIKWIPEGNTENNLPYLKKMLNSVLIRSNKVLFIVGYKENMYSDGELCLLDKNHHS